MSVELHSGRCIGFTLISYLHYATPGVQVAGMPRMSWLSPRRRFAFRRGGFALPKPSLEGGLNEFCEVWRTCSSR